MPARCVLETRVCEKSGIPAPDVTQASKKNPRVVCIPESANGFALRLRAQSCLSPALAHSVPAGSSRPAPLGSWTADRLLDAAFTDHIRGVCHVLACASGNWVWWPVVSALSKCPCKPDKLNASWGNVCVSSPPRDTQKDGRPFHGVTTFVSVCTPSS